VEGVPVSAFECFVVAALAVFVWEKCVSIVAESHYGIIAWLGLAWAVAAFGFFIAGVLKWLVPALVLLCLAGFSADAFAEEATYIDPAKSSPYIDTTGTGALVLDNVITFRLIGKVTFHAAPAASVQADGDAIANAKPGDLFRISADGTRLEKVEKREACKR